MSAFGETLKKQRKAVKLTQRELAAASGVSQKAISEIESGKRKPLNSTIAALAEAISVEEGTSYAAAAGDLEGIEQMLAKRFRAHLSCLWITPVGVRQRVQKLVSYLAGVVLDEVDEAGRLNDAVARRVAGAERAMDMALAAAAGEIVMPEVGNLSFVLAEKRLQEKYKGDWDSERVQKFLDGLLRKYAMEVRDGEVVKKSP